MERDDDISDDELLALPADDIPPSRLVEFFTRRAAIAQERKIAELLLELSGNSARHYLIFPGQDAKEKQRREDERRTEEYARAITERQNRLLVQIEERQREVEQRRQEIENNAIRLHDGRRAYIDGDRYRDGEGRALAGADETEAARQHQYQPHASTWQQKPFVRNPCQPPRCDISSDGDNVGFSRLSFHVPLGPSLALGVIIELDDATVDQRTDEFHADDGALRVGGIAELAGVFRSLVCQADAALSPSSKSFFAGLEKTMKMTATD